jgi:steroid delta-isomerase-like uncharacterized protein
VGGHMTNSDNEKAILKSYEAFNNRDINGFLEVYADDLTINFPSGRIGKGKKVIEAWYIGTIDCFPDCKYRIERTATKGNTVWLELTGIGTHAKEYLGIPASNKVIEFPGVVVLDFVDGKVKYANEYFNMERIKRILSGKMVE